jgi:hypothetical protein
MCQNKNTSTQIIGLASIKLDSGRALKFVIFQVLTAVSMETTAFWDVAPCTLVQVDRHVYCLHRRPDDEGITQLWNVGILIQDTRHYVSEGCYLRVLIWSHFYFHFVWFILWATRGKFLAEPLYMGLHLTFFGTF